MVRIMSFCQLELDFCEPLPVGDVAYLESDSREALIGYFELCREFGVA